MPHHSPHKGQWQQHRVHAAQYAKRAVGQLLQRRIIGRILARFSGIIKVTVQVGRPLGNVLGGPDRAQGLVIGRAILEGQGPEGALGSFPDCGQYILRTDGLAGGAAPAAAGGQGAVITGSIDGIGYALPIGIGGGSVGVNALILGGTADCPIKLPAR